MSQRELPLWARGVAAVLMVVASWWLVHTEAVTRAMGSSVGVLGLGVVAASIIRGLGVKLGLWPDAERRERFLPWVVVAVAAGFAVPLALSRPTSSLELLQAVDRGVWLLVVAGVVAWGFSVALVYQRRYLLWFAVAAGAAVLPYLVALVAGEAAQVCLLSAGSEGSELFCDISLLRGGFFLASIHTAGALVTYELGFRRLLIGAADGAGLVIVLGAATVAMGWMALIGPAIPGLHGYGWIFGLGAVCAGSLYVLSQSLLVSALYTGLVPALHLGLLHARDIVGETTGTALAFGGLVTWLHLGVAAALSAVVVRRNGVLGGLR